jgi:peroxin-5
MDKKALQLMNNSFSTHMKDGLNSVAPNWINEFGSSADLELAYQRVLQSNLTQEWATQFNQTESDSWTRQFDTFKEQEMSVSWDEAFKSVNSQDIRPIEEQSFEDIWNEISYQGLSTANVNYTDYQLQGENEKLNSAISFDEGLRLMKEGSLGEAILCFEAFIQQNEHDSRIPEAWMYLGLANAEYEKEIKAIAAFEKCITLDPSNANALLALAISYTNEGLEQKTFELLSKWLHQNYPETRLNTAANRDLLIQGFASNINSSKIDPNLQLGLGVLFYNNGEYQKAIDCFKIALSIKPDDYLLWNRLGATLANSGQSEQAGKIVLSYLFSEYL